MKTNIQVALRMRPQLPFENQTNISCLQIKKRQKAVYLNSKDNVKKFSFDQLFDQHDSQHQIFQQLQIPSMLDKVIQGYSATIFAYGMTGSGKTFTMEGNQEGETGLIPRVANYIFQKIQRQDRIFTVKCTYLQIYNQKIYDLLSKAPFLSTCNGFSQAGLRLRWDKVRQFSVQNLFTCECRSAAQLIQRWQSGAKYRVTGVNKLNSESSRSHTMLSIIVQSTSKGISGGSRVSRIELVDLAGSERSSYLSEQTKIKQSVQINLSLFTLRKVISCLSQTQTSLPPFRQSKLTSLIKHSIGGQSFCLMIGCLSPVAQFDNQNELTLKFASKVSKVVNKPVLNENPLVRQIDLLKSQIVSLQNQNKALRDMLDPEFVKQFQSKHVAQGKEQRKLKTEMESPTSQIEINFQIKTIKDHFSKNYQQFSSRMIDSIRTTRQLLQSNKELRSRIDSLVRKIQFLEEENYSLQNQNQQLREKDHPKAFELRRRVPILQLQSKRQPECKRLRLASLNNKNKEKDRSLRY